ncbi:MAG: hypothetical protein AAGA58_13330 [Verrucomicrobiota bacterium]
MSDATAHPESIPAEAPSKDRLQEVIRGEPGVIGKVKTVFLFVLKLFIGAWLCQGMYGALGPLSFLGAIAVIGWTYRAMQRQALKVWWKRSPVYEEGIRFATFAGSHESTREHVHWPNWFISQSYLHAWPSKRNIFAKAWYAFSRLFASFFRNVGLGFLGLFTTLVLTIIPAILWEFSWYQGWNNSFTKGYEQAAVGPSVFLFGAFLFAIAMLYVPMAQARHAVTREWRAFFHFRSVLRIIMRRWFYCFLLALGYLALTTPISFFRGGIYFMGLDPVMETMTPVEQLERLRGTILLFCLVVVFPAFILLRLAAARIYAGAVKELVEAGQSHQVSIRPFEADALGKLRVAELPPQKRWLPTKILLFTSSMTGRVVTAILAFLVWFGFAVQPVASVFLNWQPGFKGFLNRPLVQMPWCHWVPQQLVEDAKADKNKEKLTH